MIRTLTVTTPATARALVTVAAAKADLSISGSADDAWLTDAIKQASDALAAYCGRPEGFGVETLAETWRTSAGGESADSLFLSRDLAPAVSSVTEDGVAVDAADRILDGSRLLRLSGDIPSVWRAAKTVVAYTAGYTLPAGAEAGNVPEDLRRCCLDLVVRGYQGRGRDPGLRSERILDVIAQSWDTPGGDGFKGGLPRDVADRLSRYVRVRVPE